MNEYQMIKDWMTWEQSNQY